MTSAAAAALLIEHGRNELDAKAPPSRIAIFLRQFKGVMNVLLLVAGILSVVAGDVGDAIAILAIALLNAVVGAVQEARAERALDALSVMTAPRARVKRDGRPEERAAAEVVPGDLLLLEAGDVVAADGILVESSRLQVAESVLTGESVPVQKKVGATPAGTPLAERTGEVFTGTHVAAGTAHARVTATGRNTELGRIAGLLESAHGAETPLKVQLEKVGRTLVLVCLGVVAVVGVLGAIRGMPWMDVLVMAISLAVAAVPEGLLAIVTVALAVGLERLSKRNVLVRRLPAVETLGCTTIICTDKTGTLTTGKMAVREAWPKVPATTVPATTVPATRADSPLQLAALACDEELSAHDGTPTLGDPTEIAIVVGLSEMGVRLADLEASRPRLATAPFDTERRRMGVLRGRGDGNQLIVKGAPETVLGLCSDVPAEAAAELDAMAERGLRVLAVGVKDDVADELDDQGLHFAGFVGIADPPRPEARAAIAAARAAGVRTIMITGDHQRTATAIARELGLLQPGDDPAEIVKARATPEGKLTLVRSLVANGEVVAMTGDGVNDAPALQEAHVGIAMGKAGTEVTRRASAIVLADDNYASIVAGIEEGRGVYDNIQKTVIYLLGGNVGELLLMFIATAALMPIPLLPVQLLWVNLVTDGLPGLMLVMDPPAKGVLARPPRAPGTPILNRRAWRRVALIAGLETVVTFATYIIALPRLGEDAARAITFMTLVFSQLFRSLIPAGEVSSMHIPTRRLGLVVAVSGLLQLFLPLVPGLGPALGADSLPTALIWVAPLVGCIPTALLALVGYVKMIWAPSESS
ncbi:MAG: cation-translocating P-type ATPase [Myxococcales bacterium]|nr:cation-translocating P-type ATPase [Myxococcales bacterium]